MTEAQHKVLYLFDHSDWQSRMPVAEAARAQGHEVIIALIGPKEMIGKPPERFDTKHIYTSENRLGALSLLNMVGQIRRIIKEVQPDTIHTVTIKYAFITGLAALPFKNLKNIYTLAGLGYLFRSHNAKANIIRLLISPALKYVLKAPNTRLIFQNPDDLDLMVAKGFAKKEHSILIRGSGVNLEKFAAQNLPENKSPIILMPTRLVHEKGISIFVKAAHIIKERGIEARFQVAGGETKHNPKAISRAEMEEMTKDGVVKWLGHVENMPALLTQADIIAYPSYYGEGIPRVLLEACAIGRPIITTDHPGCREAVTDRDNGFLVPVKDANAVADAIEKLLNDKILRAKMAQNSRKRAEKEFDIKIIVGETLKTYQS